MNKRMQDDGPDLALLYPEYSRYGKHLKKALDAVHNHCVKKHVFEPSGRVVYSVVGNVGDEFVDQKGWFCSCSHFFFRVLNGQDELCYHLLSLKIALESGGTEQIEFDDDEFEGFMTIFLEDVFRNARDKGDKGT